MSFISHPVPDWNTQGNSLIPPGDAQYAQELLCMAKQREDKVFNNGKPAHAAIVMENIFRETRKNPRGGEVRIYAKNLNGEISRYANYRHALLEFLLAGTTSLKVIIDSEPESVVTETNAFDLLKTFSKTRRLGDKIQMKRVANAEKVTDLIQKEFAFTDVHFAVSTENMYRFEIDSTLHFADCSFNGKAKSQHLISVFDTLFSNKGKQYTIPLS